MINNILDRYSDISEPVHGGSALPDGLIDFSISVNPFALPESAAEAYRSAWSAAGKYPDDSCRSLRAGLSEAFSTDPARLVVTNGSAEAFSLIASVFLSKGKSSMVLPPCYSDYQHVSKLAGASVVEHRACAGNGFRSERDSLISGIRELKPDLIWLCSPNNPTGLMIDDKLIAEAADEAAGYGGWLVLDQAYSAFGKQPADDELYADCSNLIHVRSLTKDFGIPGLRLGYLDAPPEAARVLELQKPCWSVSSPAQAVGEALLGELDYFRRSWREIRRLHDSLSEKMAVAGVDPLAASANSCTAFTFFRKPELPQGLDFTAEMYNRGIRIRDCASMGAPGYCRIGTRLAEDNERFISALKAVVSGGVCG